MARALEIAARGRGFVEPNPMVGAVLVDRATGRFLGEGFHARYGGPHAETAAIAAAATAAGPAGARGATLCVTLEPCAHHGKTPPCTDAIVRAGIARVVAAIRDPNPDAAGGGIERLRAAGVEAEVLPPASPHAIEARRLTAPFRKLAVEKLPFVTLKWAMSLDGKIATVTGESRWITSEESRRLVHDERARADAVIVGIGTALRDDPELTVRGVADPPRRPLRVVVDARARLPLDSRLVRSSTAPAAGVLVAATAAAPEERLAALRRRGVETIVCGDGSGGVDLRALLAALAARRPRPVTNAIVEGGGTVHAAFLEAGLADRLLVFVAPKVLGGAAAPTPVEGAGRARLEDAMRVARLRARSVGPDILLTADLREGV